MRRFLEDGGDGLIESKEELLCLPTLTVLLLVPRAILEGETNGDLPLLFAAVLDCPNEVAAGQGWVFVVVWNNRRDLSADQLNSVFTQVVLWPSTWIQSGVVALLRIQQRLPGSQRMLSGTATIYFAILSLTLVALWEWWEWCNFEGACRIYWQEGKWRGERNMEAG